ncbi:uncharacterized protein LOC118733623 [Rhagoletis pomonella]|uniref:uncharacterized protein LOC118733623 n=1 Tax=Rhagoletis pomonella TaxID=28610 RepID=UPI00177ABEB1|nr:uncharacterized protein LOC118733623 [Rhagoletis pomonella]
MDGYSVTLTTLDWIVYGGRNRGVGERCNYVHFANVDNGLERLERLVSDYLINEDLNVREGVQDYVAADIVRAKELLETTTVRKGSHFETGLLWRQENVELPNSRKMAEKRLLALEKKFKCDNKFKSAYVHVMKEYEAKGYARKLTADEILTGGKRSWFLPHFGVWNANKPGKMRLVFDAAAEVNNVSLNSTLLSGPDLNQPLATILTKFRQKQVGVCADIVEMFHQVKIRAEDQAAQRFLWRTHPEHPIEVYTMSAMTFGVICSPSSAQFVKNKNAEEFRVRFPEAVEAIVNNHYVDDFVHCFSTVDEAIRITEQIVWVHKQGGFELKRFVSNSEQLTKRMNNKEERPSYLNLDRDNAVQQESFAEEYYALMAGENLERSSSLRTLTPALDEVRMIQVETPSRHRARGILLSQNLEASNEGMIIAEIQRRYWIPQFRAEVRRAARRCQVCVREKGQAESPTNEPTSGT